MTKSSKVTLTSIYQEGAEMITTSLMYLDWKTQTELIKLDWLSTKPHGTSYFLERAEDMKWIKCRVRKGTKGELEYSITAKGRRMVDNRD